MDILIDAKIPIIGHNCLYDVMYIYHQFIDYFPETYEEFSKAWGNLFTTYDTKIMIRHCRFIKESSLEKAYEI